MNLKEYLEKIKCCVAVIDKQLEFVDKRTKGDCIPGGSVSETINFDYDFSIIYTKVGIFRLCSCILYSTEIENYNIARERIREELGLVKKERKIHYGVWSDKFYLEDYYILPEVELEGTHTSEEVREVWDSLPPR